MTDHPPTLAWGRLLSNCFWTLASGFKQSNMIPGDEYFNMALQSSLHVKRHTRSHKPAMQLATVYFLQAHSHRHHTANRMRIQSGLQAFTWIRLNPMSIECTLSPVTVNLVRRGIWSGGHNSLGKLVRRTEFPNFVHREISPGLRNLVRAIQ